MLGIGLCCLFFYFVFTEKTLTQTYFSSGQLNITDTTNISCSAETEANVYSSSNKKIFSKINKNPGGKISLGINLPEKKLSIITDTAVRSGVVEPDQYEILSYVPGLSLTAVGYSGASIVTVIINIKESTVVISKAVDFLGPSGNLIFATCN